jgi:DNA-binding LacI/PurR family transcriptional regulator
MHGGRGVNTAQVDYGRYRHPAPVLKSLIETHQAGALLLHLAPNRWIETAAELLPTYLMGGEWVDTECSGDSSSLRADVTQALSELRDLGHERVLIPVEPHLAGFRKKIHGVLRDTFKKSLNRGLIEDLCPIFSESVPGVWQDYWDRAFSRTAPSAVILLKDAHVLSLYGYCTSHQIAIPSDLSVIYLGYSELLGWCQPPPCQMRFPLKRAIAHFREWIRGGLRPVGMKHFELDKIPGASMARARRGALPKGGKP